MFDKKKKNKNTIKQIQNKLYFKTSAYYPSGLSMYTSSPGRNLLLRWLKQNWQMLSMFECAV